MPEFKFQHLLTAGSRSLGPLRVNTAQLLRRLLRDCKYTRPPPAKTPSRLDAIRSGRLPHVVLGYVLAYILDRVGGDAATPGISIRSYILFARGSGPEVDPWKNYMTYDLDILFCSNGKPRTINVDCA